MKVKKRMIRKPITIDPEASIPEAIELMKKYSIRHLPVVEGDKFVGLVTEGDIRQALIPSMIDQIKIKDVMIKNPITIHPDASLEEAATLIYHYKIGGLPVIDNDKVVGIITVNDILAAFIELMGVLQSSSRLDVILGEDPKAFEDVSRIIKENGGEIISVGITNHPEKEKRIYFFRLEKCNISPLVKALEKKGYKIASVLP